MNRSWIVVMIALAGSFAAYAADAPESVVKYRQTVMSEVGKHMRASTMIAKGEITTRPNDLVGHAVAIHDASIGFVELFPAGTGPDKVKTEAKAEIWTDAAKFAAAARSFQDETGKLVDIAKAGDLAGYTAQIAKVGDTCGACHDPFKVKDH